MSAIKRPALPGGYLKACQPDRTQWVNHLRFSGKTHLTLFPASHMAASAPEYFPCSGHSFGVMVTREISPKAGQAGG